MQILNRFKAQSGQLPCFVDSPGEVSTNSSRTLNEPCQGKVEAVDSVEVGSTSIAESTARMRSRNNDNDDSFALFPDH